MTPMMSFRKWHNLPKRCIDCEGFVVINTTVPLIEILE
jgi:hypothetical protein